MSRTFNIGFVRIHVILLVLLGLWQREQHVYQLIGGVLTGKQHNLE